MILSIVSIRPSVVIWWVNPPLKNGHILQKEGSETFASPLHQLFALQDIFAWVLPLQTAEVPPENDRLKYHHEIVWLLKAHTAIDKSRYVHLILQPSLFTYFILFPCPWKHQQIDFRETMVFTSIRTEWFSASSMEERSAKQKLRSGHGCLTNVRRYQMFRY